MESSLASDDLKRNEVGYRGKRVHIKIGNIAQIKDTAK
jgi:hypothetical protein